MDSTRPRRQVSIGGLRGVPLQVRRIDSVERLMSVIVHQCRVQVAAMHDGSDGGHDDVRSPVTALT